jgi:ubiquinone/menaquinone biosynthesis C-methylase UbiE
MAKTEAPTQLYIPNPRVDRAGESHVFYTNYYQGERSDSPDQGRLSILRRLDQAMSELPQTSFVLDIGAGKQALESEYRNIYGNSPHRFMTLDIANVSREQLLAPGFEHMIANGEQMPFPDNTFSLAASNMAIDFMHREALSEVGRILKPGAKLLLNLHHPRSIIPPDLN